MPRTLNGRKADLAYEFVNWFLDGWAGAYLNRQGYYSAVLETAKSKMEPYEWAYWMEGKPAEKDIKAPDGTLLEKAGVSRDGGSMSSAWVRSRAGMLSWTRTTISSRNGTSSSRREALSPRLQGELGRDL